MLNPTRSLILDRRSRRKSARLKILCKCRGCPKRISPLRLKQKNKRTPRSCPKQKQRCPNRAFNTFLKSTLTVRATQLFLAQELTPAILKRALMAQSITRWLISSNTIFLRSLSKGRQPLVSVFRLPSRTHYFGIRKRVSTKTPQKYLQISKLCRLLVNTREKVFPKTNFPPIKLSWIKTTLIWRIKNQVRLTHILKRVKTVATRL